MNVNLWWANISIAKKLYFIVGIMSLLVICELLTLKFSLNTISAARAFVSGEGIWSKAQKDAAINLEYYVINYDEKNYQAFLNFLKIPISDSIARLEIEKQNPDLNIARQGFLAGKFHPRDVDPVIQLLLRFHKISYIKKAVAIWTKGDALLAQFKNVGNQYHSLIASKSTDIHKRQELSRLLYNLNEELSTLENQFSEVLGEASRWLESAIVFLLLMFVVTVESIGISLAFLTSRRISHGLKGITKVAAAIGEGDFSKRLHIQSQDEIGQVAKSINAMGSLLERSYGELEHRIQERTIELKEAIQLRDTFLSIASHELKTPLTSLLLQTDIKKIKLKNKSLPITNFDEIRQMIELDERQINYLIRIINELFDFTSVKTGKFSIMREELNLSNWVKDIVARFTPMLEDAGYQLLLDIDTHIIGCFDRFRIEQVLVNLLMNAMKYGEGNPICIALKMLANNKLRLTIRDNGIGVATEDQSRIFLPFERINSIKKSTGIGVGLYIVKEIIQAHGGSISLRSEMGNGSDFIIELDIVSPVVAA